METIKNISLDDAFSCFQIEYQETYNTIHYTSNIADKDVYGFFADGVEKGYWYNEPLDRTKNGTAIFY